MRQTNIFWVAVFMGGLELVRTIKANKQDLPSEQPIPRTWQEMTISRLKKYSRGDIHDIALRHAGVHGMLSFVKYSDHC
jgi:alpha-1,2-glucosyltransferase